MAASHSVQAAQPVALVSATPWEVSEQDLSPFGKLCIVSKTFDENTRLYVQRASDNRISLGLLFDGEILDSEKFYRTNVFVDVLYEKAITARPLSSDEVVLSLGEDLAFLASMEKAREMSVGLDDDLYIFKMSGFDTGKKLLDKCLGIEGEEYPQDIQNMIQAKLEQVSPASPPAVVRETPPEPAAVAAAPDEERNFEKVVSDITAAPKPSGKPVNLVKAILPDNDPVAEKEVGGDHGLQAGYVSKRIDYGQKETPAPATVEKPASQEVALEDITARNKPAATEQVVEDNSVSVTEKETSTPVAGTDITAAQDAGVSADELLRAPADNHEPAMQEQQINAQPVPTQSADTTAADKRRPVISSATPGPVPDMARQLEAEEAAFSTTQLPAVNTDEASQRVDGPVSQESAAPVVMAAQSAAAAPASAAEDAQIVEENTEPEGPGLVGKVGSFFKKANPFGGSSERDTTAADGDDGKAETDKRRKDESSVVLAEAEPQAGVDDPVKKLLDMKPTDGVIEVIREDEMQPSAVAPSVDPELRRAQSEESARLVAAPATGEDSAEAIAVYHDMPSGKGERKKGGPILEGTAMLLPESEAPVAETADPREQIHVFKLGEDGQDEGQQAASPKEIRITESSCEVLPDPVKKLQPYLTGNKNYDESQEVIENLKVQIRLLEREKEALRSKMPEDPGALSVIRSCVKEDTKISSLEEEVQKLKVMNFDLIQELGGYNVAPPVESNINEGDVEELKNNVDELIKINNSLEMQVRELKTRLAADNEQQTTAAPEEETQIPRAPEDITEPAAPDISAGTAPAEQTPEAP